MLTVKDLRDALAGLPDDMPVVVGSTSYDVDLDMRYVNHDKAKAMGTRPFYFTERSPDYIVGEAWLLGNQPTQDAPMFCISDCDIHSTSGRYYDE